MNKKIPFFTILLCLFSISCTLNIGTTGKIAVGMPSNKSYDFSSSRVYAPEDLPEQYTLEILYNSLPFFKGRISEGEIITFDNLDLGDYELSVTGTSNYYNLQGFEKVNVSPGKTTKVVIPLEVELIPQEMTLSEAENFLFQAGTPIPQKPIAIKIKGNFESSDLSTFTRVTLNKDYRPANIPIELDFSESTFLREIESGVFSGAESLRKIILPSTITTLKESCFKDCKTLEEINLENITNLDGSYIFENCTSLKEVNLSKVIAIPVRAFQGCTHLQEITFCDNLREIGEQAFYQCSSLEKIELPDSLTKIDIRCFYECTKLQKVKLSENQNFTELPDFVFQLTGLKSITIPDNITKIADTTFDGCNDLKSAKFEDTTSVWEKDKWAKEEYTPSSTDFLSNAKVLTGGYNLTKKY